MAIVSVQNTETPDFSTVISTADLKAHLRVTHSDEDSIINSYRTAACQFVENYCNTRLTDHTVNFYANYFSSVIELTLAPCIRVNNVKYSTAKGAALTTLSSTQYYTETNRNPAVIKFMTAPSVNTDDIAPIVINADIGYSTAPEALVQAVRFLVSHYYENRQAAEVAKIKEVPIGVFSLMEAYRTISFK